MAKNKLVMALFAMLFSLYGIGLLLTDCATTTIGGALCEISGLDMILGWSHDIDYGTMGVATADITKMNYFGIGALGACVIAIIMSLIGSRSKVVDIICMLFYFGSAVLLFLFPSKIEFITTEIEIAGEMNAIGEIKTQLIMYVVMGLQVLAGIFMFITVFVNGSRIKKKRRR